MSHHKDTGTMELPDGDQMGNGGELDSSKQEEEVDARRGPSGRGLSWLGYHALTYLEEVL